LTTTRRGTGIEPTATSSPEGSGADRFARVCALLGLDAPDLFAPRRPAVLAAFKAATELEPTQLRAIIRAQHPHVTVRQRDGTATLGGELQAALGCLREEARDHGRLVALGQAWAGCNRLGSLIAARRPVLTQVVASAVAGEVLCRLLEDVQERRVLSRDDEELLRHAWRQAHPAPPYLRRRFSATTGSINAGE
jgi:hypothetical protein